MEKITFDFFKNNIFLLNDKKFNKKEQEFLTLIRDKYELKNQDSLIFNRKELEQITKHKETIEFFLEKFSKRKINLSLNEKDKSIFFASFSIFDFYFRSGDDYKFFLSSSLKHLKKIDIFKKLDLLLILLFKSENSFPLYLHMMRNLNQGEFLLTKNELKEILGVEQESYERFFDFEKIILKPVLEDINNLTQYNISYSKIKNTEGSTSKIVKIQFFFHHKLSSHVLEEIDKILLPIWERVASPFKIAKLIETTMLNEGIDFVKRSLYNIDKGILGSLDEVISLALKQTTLNDPIESYVLVSQTSSIFINKFFFESKLYVELLKSKFYYNYNFLKSLRNIQIGVPLEYKDSNHKIEILYLDKGRESSINIYKTIEKEN
ncbi:MAG: hypothetical protein ACRC6A_05165 [Fusobacteriaceae bacterium]